MSDFAPVDQQLKILMRGVEFGDPTTRTNMEAELRQRLTSRAATNARCVSTAVSIRLPATCTWDTRCPCASWHSSSSWGMRSSS